jgi:hypothetical protein
MLEARALCHVLGLPKALTAKVVANSFVERTRQETLDGETFSSLIFTTVRTMADIYEYGPIDRRLEKALGVFYAVVVSQDTELLGRVDRILMKACQ